MSPSPREYILHVLDEIEYIRSQLAGLKSIKPGYSLDGPDFPDAGRFLGPHWAEFTYRT
jgi:hypothetical protein